jgi:Domain of unknown function (DU1801)
LRNPPPELIGFLLPYDRVVQDLALELRGLVLDELAPCYESIYDAYSAVAMSYGTSGRMKDQICHVAVYARHVNLGFNHGATLDDPYRVLEGSGKQVRHITIKALEDLERPELRAYLQHARERVGPGTSSELQADEVVSVVKAIYPNKRRPR